MFDHFRTNYSDSFTGFEFNKDKVINSNLIVVPHNVFNQWNSYILD